MAYIASNDIYMFPVANRGDAFPLSRLTTEQNIVNILKSMSDKDGFVISQNKPSGTIEKGSSDSFEFVVGGYYVNTTNVKLPVATSSGYTLYAKIKLAKYGSNIYDHNQELITQESSNNSEGRIDFNQSGDNSNFTALSFTWESSVPSPTANECIIPILYFDGTNYIIKEEYRYKIDRNSIDDQWINLAQQS